MTAFRKQVPKLSVLLSMTVFGTIGLFRRWIPLPSGLLALSRGYIGAGFLLLVLLFKKERADFSAIRKNLLLLIVSGAAIGFNWILLFEAYRFTSVSLATLCYYTAPIFVLLAAPVFLGEKWSLKKLLPVFLAILGMLLVSGVLKGESGEKNLRGILLGVGAAVLYASVILMNKKITGVSAYDRTIVQLLFAATVLVPYTIFMESPVQAEFTGTALVLLLLVGIVHTGIAYALYFGAMEKLPAGTLAILSYVDPLVALLLSAVFLRERMDLPAVIGAVLILGAAILTDLPEKQSSKE